MINQMKETSEDKLMENTINLVFDNAEVTCDIVAQFSVQAIHYLAVKPLENDEILVYRLNVLIGDEIELVQIENDEEFNNVMAALTDLLNNGENL